jgi:AAA+ ATPase superfamily predicted ATPase
MENPFIFGEVAKGRQFTDREEELRTLMLDLSSGQSVLLFSPRRFGKTSLIIRILEQLKAKGLLVVYVDLFGVTSLAGFGRMYADAITRATSSKLQEAVRFVREHFPTIVPKVIVKGGQSAEVEIGFEAPRHDTEKWLSDIYDMPQTIAKRKHKRVVVVFDEFQEVATLGPKESVERGLRSKIQHHDQVAYVFMGSKRHLLDELFVDKNKPLYRFAKSMVLGRIPKDKFTAFIKERFQSAGIAIDALNVSEILSLTECHPYYTQQFCHEICNATLPRKHVTLTDIARAKESLLQSQSYAYTTIWESLSPKQRQVMAALCQNTSANLYSDDFMRRFSLGMPTIQTAMKALLKKGLVEKENSHYVLTDIFFTEWIRRKTGS